METKRDKETKRGQGNKKGNKKDKEAKMTMRPLKEKLKRQGNNRMLMVLKTLKKEKEK